MPSMSHMCLNLVSARFHSLAKITDHLLAFCPGGENSPDIWMLKSGERCRQRMLPLECSRNTGGANYTISGSLETGLKALPRLVTRGFTVSAGPRSRMTT